MFRFARIAFNAIAFCGCLAAFVACVLAAGFSIGVVAFIGVAIATVIAATLLFVALTVGIAIWIGDTLRRIRQLKRIHDSASARSFHLRNIR